MNRNEIQNKVIKIADKFGADNPQQIKQLSFIFKNYDPVEVFYGLYNVFLISGDQNYDRQQFAGVLLYKINPRLSINLLEVIKDCLDTWNVSVEELPFYLRDLCGLNKITETLLQIRSLDLNPNEINSLNTMEWWLGLRKNG